MFIAYKQMSERVSAKVKNKFRKVKIFDTTLRDGEQSPGATMTQEEKICVAKQLAKLNVDVIEAGFPIASEEDFEAVMEIAKQVNGPVIAGLARAKQEDIDKAWRAVQYSRKPRIHTFMSTSNIHLKEQFKVSKKKALEMSVSAVKYAKHYCEDIEFSPMDATRTDKDFLYEVLEAVIGAGATTVNIPDTVGYAQTQEFGEMIEGIFENVPNIKNANVSVHCHNDLGLAVANSLAAIRAGATQVECTINGLGERAGNAAMEEIVMAIKTRPEYYSAIVETNTQEIINTSRMVSEITGINVQRNKAIVGENAFAHESGIHQQGIINSKRNYEIMDAGSVGSESILVIGRHSGKHAVREFLKKKGNDYSDESVQKHIEKIKNSGRKNFGENVVVG